MESEGKKKRKIFNFDIDQELHKKLAMICIEQEISMKSFVTEALKEKIEREEELK